MAQLPPPVQDQFPSTLRKPPDPWDPMVSPMEVESTPKKNSFKEILADNNLTKSNVYHPNYYQEEAALKMPLQEDTTEEIFLTLGQKKRESITLGCSR